jgi:hypothetical protein
LPAGSLALLGVALLVGGCGSGNVTQGPSATDPSGERAIAFPAVRFSDVTAKAGIHFVHTNGAFGKKLLSETMGGGVAFPDFNKDGKPDLLFINSCYWPGHEGQGPAPTLRLYRNDSQGGDIRFTDVTREYGLDVTMYGMGVTVGDYDNDGWPDVFVTGVGGNRLFRNARGKQFEDVTARAGVGGPGGWPAGAGDFLKWNRPINWSTSAAWLDYDGDGRLDLFVCNYVSWSPDYDLKLEATLAGTAEPAYAFSGTQCFLYHNRGDGTFEEVGKACGVGLAADGRARGAMGIDEGEYAPGRRGLLIGNFADEPDSLLALDSRARPGGKKLSLFSDVAVAEGLAGPSQPLLKFGAFFFDYDLDGRLDVLTCNGHLEPGIARVHPGQSYLQPPQLFRNTGREPRRFEPVTGHAAAATCCCRWRAGPAPTPTSTATARSTWCSWRTAGRRGCCATRAPPATTGFGLRWRGTACAPNRSAIGARVTLEAGGTVQHREVASARGYLSQSELTLTFGLGPATAVDRVTIRRPGKEGGETVVTDLKADRVHEIRQGE